MRPNRNKPNSPQYIHLILFLLAQSLSIPLPSCTTCTAPPPAATIDPVTKSQRPSWLFLPSVFTTPLLTTLQVSSLLPPHQEGTHTSLIPISAGLPLVPISIRESFQQAYLLWQWKLKLSSRGWKTELAPNYTWPFRIWPLLPQLST